MTAATTLDNIFEVVMARVRATPGLERLQAELGPEWEASNRSPPSIVWTPSDDDFDGDPKGATDPTAVCEADEGLIAHVWGEDWQATRELRRRLILALHRHLRGSYRLVRGVWVPGNAGLVREGRLYQLVFFVRVPVVRDPLPVATPDGVRINPQVTTP